MRLRRGLLFESPEVDCYFFGAEALDVPVEEEVMAAIPVSRSGDAAAVSSALAVGSGQVTLLPDVAHVAAGVIGPADNISPLSVFVIGKIDCAASLRTFGELGWHEHLVACHIGFAAEFPAIDDEADGLLPVGIAGASIYVH